jgi:hypothetical protein
MRGAPVLAPGQQPALPGLLSFNRIFTNRTAHDFRQDIDADDDGAE